MSAALKKIVILGPESTGKSTLCAGLAKHYNTTWCPEYAREYLLANGTNYTFDNLLTVAQGQLALEDKHTAGALINMAKENTSPYLFIDTDMYVMKVWCEYVFQRCHHFILEEINNRKYDLYLLCNTDLPWTKDELREYPDEKNRIELFHIYKDILINQSTPWAIISGTDEERLQCAIEVIEGGF